MLIHPEGQPYYFRDCELKIVTEASINRSEVWDKLSEWINGVEGALRCKGILPTESMELFLQPHEDWKSCGYYFANHATRSLFWLDQVSSELIGYDGNTSFSHLSACIPLISIVIGTEEVFRTLVGEIILGSCRVLPHASGDHLIANNRRTFK